MAWLCKDKDGTEWICEDKPTRDTKSCCPFSSDNSWYAFEMIQIPSGSIAKLIGRELTWEDELVMIE